MDTPKVRELPRRLEPVSRDTFLGGTDHAADDDRRARTPSTIRQAAPRPVRPVTLTPRKGAPR